MRENSVSVMVYSVEGRSYTLADKPVKMGVTIHSNSQILGSQDVFLSLSEARDLIAGLESSIKDAEATLAELA
jgi:hypothetical protein